MGVHDVRLTVVGDLLNPAVLEELLDVLATHPAWLSRQTHQAAQFVQFHPGARAVRGEHVAEVDRILAEPVEILPRHQSRRGDCREASACSEAPDAPKGGKVRASAIGLFSLLGIAGAVSLAAQVGGGMYIITAAYLIFLCLIVSSAWALMAGIYQPDQRAKRR